MPDHTKVVKLNFTPEDRNAIPPCANSPANDTPLSTATQSQRAIPPPSITVRLGINRVVFLITELQELPELDIRAPEECQMHFRLMPGLLLTSPPKPPEPQESEPGEAPEPNSSPEAEDHQKPEPKEPTQIVCPILPSLKTLAGRAQILQAAMENENPFYGLAMFAKILALPEYMDLVPLEISVNLPYSLVQELFPDEAKGITIPSEAYSAEGELTPRQVGAIRAQTPIKVNFALPSGYPLPELYRGKIVRVSLNLATHTGGLALNDRSTMLVNSRSRPSCICIAPTNHGAPMDDYYQLRGIGPALPVTSELPDFYEDYTEMLDPTAAYLARHGIKP